MATRFDTTREHVFVRFTYPLENRLLRWFGRREECGCETLLTRRLRLCWDHASAESTEVE